MVCRREIELSGYQYAFINNLIQISNGLTAALEHILVLLHGVGEVQVWKSTRWGLARERLSTHTFSKTKPKTIVCVCVCVAAVVRGQGEAWAIAGS